MSSEEVVRRIADRVKEEFEGNRRILTFDAWLELFYENPRRLARCAAQLVADMFAYYGIDPPAGEDGAPRRYRLFDLEFLDGRGRIHGQEDVQERIHRIVRTAAGEGRTEKLILLHGPNGSGKSVIVEAIFRGLEHYTRQPEGAVYRFNWVFPKSAGPGESLGFGAGGAARGEEEIDSFALLDAEELSARLVCELKDHPLFLVPAEERMRILAETFGEKAPEEDDSLRWLVEGDLSQKAKAIYEALLAAYQGDWRKVIRHVQVERYYISQRFRCGAVTIQPMGSVDASEQQISLEASVQNLPPVLQNLRLFEPLGDLVDANGGVVEFGDFLKRPMDLNKYLLNAIEKGTISLPNSLVELNLVMLGTSNEKHLDAFKTTPEFTSFKGRIELVPVPYLLEFSKEARLYEDMLRAVRAEVRVAPHTLEMAALWAVLTRLLRPDPEAFEGRLAELVAGLTPLEKAFLYDRREAPARLDREDRRILLAGLSELRNEYRDTVVYEGRFGASAREMRMVLAQAAYDPERPGLCPSLAFKAIRELIRDKTVYDFLKLKPDGGYHHPEAFVEQVKGVYARRVLDEIQEAMELIREEEYDRRFDEYLRHVIAFNRKESVRNPQTGKDEPPSERIMRAVEDLLETGESREEFRQNLVARIGAFALDHPEEEVSFRRLFPDLLQALKRQFFEARRERVRRLTENLLRHGTDEFDSLSAEDREEVERVLGNLADRHGYDVEEARDAAAFLRAHYPE